MATVYLLKTDKFRKNYTGVFDDLSVAKQHAETLYANEPFPMRTSGESFWDERGKKGSRSFQYVLGKPGSREPLGYRITEYELNVLLELDFPNPPMSYTPTPLEDSPQS